MKHGERDQKSSLGEKGKVMMTNSHLAYMLVDRLGVSLRFLSLHRRSDDDRSDMYSVGYLYSIGIFSISVKRLKFLHRIARITWHTLGTHLAHTWHAWPYQTSFQTRWKVLYHLLFAPIIKCSHYLDCWHAKLSALGL